MKTDNSIIKVLKRVAIRVLTIKIQKLTEVHIHIAINGQLVEMKKILLIIE